MSRYETCLAGYVSWPGEREAPGAGSETRQKEITRQRPSAAALACVGLSLVLVIPPLAGGQPQPTEEQVKLAVNAEMVKAHLLVSQDLYAAGQKAAATHAAHPVEELWSLLQGPLNRAGSEFATGVGALLEKPGREINARVPVKQYQTTVRTVFAAMDEAVSRLVPAPVRDSLAFRARVLLELLEHAQAEYAESVKAGKVIKPDEYQDAYGMFHRAQFLYRSIAGQVRKKAPGVAKEIQGAFATLATGFATVMPPAAPLAAEKVRDEVREIAAELGKVAGVQAAADRGSAREEIRRVRSAIQEALTAFKQGQPARAEELVVQAYLDHFEKAEGPLEQKDKTLMKRLERLSRVDLRDKIKAKAPVAAVEQLIQTILASLEQAERLLEGS